MARDDYGPAAVKLSDGTVFVSGGTDFTIFPRAGEIYDSSTGTFTKIAANMTVNRFWHTATVLSNGKVLIVGGAGESNTASLYDPATNQFAATGLMNTARGSPEAILLDNGKVLVVGGNKFVDFSTVGLTGAELYDPIGGTFTQTGSMSVGRFWHTLTKLSDGRILVIGGRGSAFSLTRTAEIYGPSTGYRLQ